MRTSATGFLFDDLGSLARARERQPYRKIKASSFQRHRMDVCVCGGGGGGGGEGGGGTDGRERLFAMWEPKKGNNEREKNMREWWF